MDTISEMVCARADDESPGLGRLRAISWFFSWSEAVHCSSVRAALVSGKLMNPPARLTSKRAARQRP